MSLTLPVRGGSSSAWLAAADPSPCDSRGLTVIGAIVLCGLVGVPATLFAESSLLLQSPRELAAIDATTFDKRGHSIGESSFEISTEDTGNLHMTVTLAVKRGGISRSEAILAPVAGALFVGTPGGVRDETPATPSLAAPRTFRLLEERSQATRADGVRLDLLVIDHAAGHITCYPRDGDPNQVKQIDLPVPDRVANVPMQLLFLPLVSGEIDSLGFQIAVCGAGPVLYEMMAVRGPKHQHNGHNGHDVIEIRYGPDLGNVVSWLASRLLPRLSMWFDANSGDYLGHRMPLYRKGPEVLLLRQGLTPLDIGIDARSN